MSNEELLKQIQTVADETAKKFIRPALLKEIYREDKEDGSTDVYVLGSDMPVLIYRIFNVKDGVATEVTDVNYCIEKSRHYNEEVKPTLKLVPPDIQESDTYDIVVENRLENGAVEIKLKSSLGRELTMIELYRYFDYVSKIFFVSCLATSFGAQYLFSVTGDSKHLKLVVTNDPAVRSRVDMMTELLRARLLPSYQTIDAADKLLKQNATAHVKLTAKTGEEQEFDCRFCYDDEETQTRFGFFGNTKDPKQGIIFAVDIFNNNKLLMADQMTQEQRDAIERIKALMKDKPEEFNKHACSFFADNLDFRYKAFKEGKLKAAEPAPAPAAEAEAK